MQKIGTTSPASLKAELAEAVMERSQASGVDSSFELESESESDFEFEIDEVNETAAASTKKCGKSSNVEWASFIGEEPSFWTSCVYSSRYGQI